MNKRLKSIQKNYDAVIVGGGLSGVCCAIAASRGGVHVALIQNRPVLGGNASSEIRMHICGADNHEKRKNARETGIIEEILLENKARNPQNSYSMFDTLIWEKVYKEPLIDLYLNTHMYNVTTDQNKTILSISCHQQTSELDYTFYGNYFVDASGDGTLSYLAGAEYMHGREGKNIFNEPHAPDHSDTVCMGNTLLFTSKNMHSPMPFVKPNWAYTYTEDDLKGRDHGATGYNYWWIELGGDELDTISDAEKLRTELTKAVFGVWDHIKNGGQHNADTYALDWIGFLPGKRESRRIKGDYILKEQDLMNGVKFVDSVAYGGWPMDMHVPGGIKTALQPTSFFHTPDIYSIPFRSLYSKNISNLLLVGRIISASHMAFGSTRVMGTCSVIGQAVGTALRILHRENIAPAHITPYINELQQILLREDAYIPSIQNCDSNDFCLKTTIHASDHTPLGLPSNVTNGISRNVHNDVNCWEAPFNTTTPPWIDIHFDSTIQLNSLELKFDSNLSKEIMLSLFKNNSESSTILPSTLVKDYKVDFFNNSNKIYSQTILDNYQRHNCIQIKAITCNRIRITVTATHGSDFVRIFEVRAY